MPALECSVKLQDPQPNRERTEKSTILTRGQNRGELWDSFLPTKNARDSNKDSLKAMTLNVFKFQSHLHISFNFSKVPQHSLSLPSNLKFLIVCFYVLH